ncbi:BTAD domain-containing putative transcriptional regulator [Roseovarius aestuariivivens]|uniref:BTAD domain-containing putative transcriptional regulator n=1 Tax=Roseovarius aestuariivivens TaxID=1888910 RepID=UPI001080DD4E|nr:BTAD domain-containing putative transcriptional regulator [Roseovarius aestuariivivens]
MAAFLWPNNTSENARGSLRQALTRLRATLDGPEEPFVTTHNSVGLAESFWSTDLDELYSAARLPPEAGRFLDGVHAREPEIQEWLETERRIVETMLESQMRQTLSECIAKCAYQDAIPVALRLISINPLEESAHLQLMDLYCQTGQRARALEIFEELKRKLDVDLGEQPSSRICDLAAKIRRSDTPKKCSSAPTAPSRESDDAVLSEEVSRKNPQASHDRDQGAFALPLETRLPIALGRTPHRSTAAVLAFFLAIGGAAWWIQSSELAPADLTKMTYALPERPSIAVLPFDNMSGDPDQEHFVDAMTDNVITDLSRFRDLFVIARNSVFVYKGQPVKVQRVAEDLGVQYLLEGGVQRSGERIRVNVQLIDALSGKHVWAERYDTQATEMFEIQDAVSRKIVTTLGGYEGEIAEAATARATRASPRKLTAYESFLLGVRHKHRFTKEDNLTARDFFRTALDLDPHLGRAHTAIAWTHMHDYWWGWTDDLTGALGRAYAAARSGLNADPSDAEAHWVLGEYFATVGDRDGMEIEYERALELNPNNADILANWGWNLAFLPGRMDEAIGRMELAFRLNPNRPSWYKRLYGQMLYFAGRFDDAIEVLGAVNDGIWPGRAILAASYVGAGRAEEASAEIRRILKTNPGASFESLQLAIPRTRAHGLEILRNRVETAGLPRCASGEEAASISAQDRLPECVHGDAGD